MSNTLLPCPFCGGEATYYYQPDLERPELKHCHNVCCDRCAATTGLCTSKEKAIAAWNRRVDARQLALKTRVCPMCEDCPDGCPVETPKDSRNIITNADRIRSMSDEELAFELLFFRPCDKYFGGTQNKNYAGLDGKYYKTGADAIEANKNWLRQPAKEDSDA